jgi:CheY-like chemotaxis protein
MAALCRHWGCHVASAGSREDAMRALEGHLRTPDLIVSDYRLRNGETGLDVILGIRGQGEQPIPAIVVTGDVSAPELEHLRFEHVVLLHKPVDVGELRRAAEALLKALADAS